MKKTVTKEEIAEQIDWVMTLSVIGGNEGHDFKELNKMHIYGQIDASELKKKLREKADEIVEEARRNGKVKE